MKTIYISLAILTIISFALADDIPKAPQWPSKFTQDFDEDLVDPVLGKQRTNGTYHYDSTTKRYRLDRSNGHYDAFCQANGDIQFKDTACSLYVDLKGDRYAHYPEINKCCFCCSSANGCGILKPNWLSDAKFMGAVDYNGVKAFKWYKKGGSDNFYYETINDDPLKRVMLGIEELPDDFFYYKKESINYDVDEDLLTLPTICNPDKLCVLPSICEKERGNQ